MKIKNMEELDALIDACLDDRLSDAEAERLSRLIEESSEARERYWELASVHGMVEQSMQSASLKAATGEEFVAPANVGWLFRLPRIAAMAAGMVEVRGSEPEPATEPGVMEVPSERVTVTVTVPPGEAGSPAASWNW